MLNAQQLAVLSGELGAQQYTSLMAAQEYDAVAALLNVQPEIANPSPRGTVPLRMTWDTFIDLLAPAEVLGMYNYGEFAGDLRRALETDARVELLALWRGAKTALAAATITKCKKTLRRQRLSSHAKSKPSPSIRPPSRRPT